MAEVKIDLHTHSEGSYDGKEPVDLIVEHVEDIDLDGCAITDHDEIDDSLEAKQIAEKSDAIMIPGCRSINQRWTLISNWSDRKTRRRSIIQKYC